MLTRTFRNRVLLFFLGVGLLTVSGPASRSAAQAPDSSAAEANAANEQTEGKQAEDDGNDEPAEAEKVPRPAVVNAGQDDLDQAVLDRLDASSEAELRGVLSLLESAIAKGLDEENQSFARKMLGSVQLELSQKLLQEMLRTRRAQQKGEVLELLSKATENDPTLVDAYMLIAQLNLPPNGNKQAVIDATTKAIELLEDDKRRQSQAYLARSAARSDDQKRLEDVNAAIEADSDNIKALLARAALRFTQGDIDGAVSDLEQVLANDPSNQAIAEAAVTELVEMNRADDALELLGKTIEAKPSVDLYRLRAMLYRMKGEDQDALDDLNKALAMQPKDPIALLQRAEILAGQGDVKGAKQDLRSATDVAPQVANATQAIYVRCLIASEEGRTADAINDMKELVQRNPDDLLRLFQLANLYRADNRPRQAVDTLTSIIDRDPENVIALRYRADALLSVGEHQKAVDDYERALKFADEEENDLAGLYNNLAWVLSTSPEDEVRNGERALELAEKAAKLSDYEAPHILSTLASAHAEVGNFEKAVEWSEKAVNIGSEEDHEQLEQLENELESYRKGEPWREKQEVEENAVPILAPEDLIET